MISLKLDFLPSCVSLAFICAFSPVSVSQFTACLSIRLSALAPGMGVAVYAGLVGALLLCVILVLCVGVLAYRRRCRHLHGDITDSSSALTAAFHPGNYKPPRQGGFSHTHTHTHIDTQTHTYAQSHTHTSISIHSHTISLLFIVFIFTAFLIFYSCSLKHFLTINFIIKLLFISSHKLILFKLLSPLI